jgi:hypothetical protein
VARRQRGPGAAERQHQAAVDGAQRGNLRAAASRRAGMGCSFCC